MIHETHSLPAFFPTQLGSSIARAPNGTPHQVSKAHVANSTRKASSPLPTPRRPNTAPAYELSLIYLEELLRSLRGEALLVAMLSYGLAVPISAVREVRVRDVGVFDRTILVRGREYPIPATIADDLREFFQERVCGSEASLAFESTHSSSILNDLLFSDGAFSRLEESARNVEAHLATTFLNTSSHETPTRFDSQLQVLARLHRKHATSKKHLITSPLELFDKGPRIVRRGRGGVIDAYYLWRASRVLVRR
jgi:hypothetical protein